MPSPNDVAQSRNSGRQQLGDGKLRGGDAQGARELASPASHPVEEGDSVVVRFKETGTSVAPFRGFPATGKSFELTAIEWFTLEDGRIAGRHGVRDGGSQARQLGWA